MNLSKIHHIAIIVSDYEAAKGFLCEQVRLLCYQRELSPGA